MRFFLVIPLTAEACQALGWDTSVGATLNPVSDDNTPLTETGIRGEFLVDGDTYEFSSRDWESVFRANDVGVGIVDEDEDFQF